MTTKNKTKKSDGLSIRAPFTVRRAIKQCAALRGVSQSDFIIAAARRLLSSMNGELLLPNSFDTIPTDEPAMLTIRLPPDVRNRISEVATRSYHKATQFVLWAALREFYDTPDKIGRALDQAVRVSASTRKKFVAAACKALLVALDETTPLEDFDPVLLAALESKDHKLSPVLAAQVQTAWDAEWAARIAAATGEVQAAKEAVRAAKKLPQTDAAAATKRKREQELASSKEQLAEVVARSENRDTTYEQRCFVLLATMRAYFAMKEGHPSD